MCVYLSVDNLFSLLVFTPASTPLSLANLLWIVTTTDHILKLGTVLLKGILAAIPIGVFPVSRRVRELSSHDTLPLMLKLRVHLFIYRESVSFSLKGPLISTVLLLQCHHGFIICSTASQGITRTFTSMTHLLVCVYAAFI